MVLTLWHCHCDGIPGSFDKCSTNASDRQPLDQAYQPELTSTETGSCSTTLTFITKPESWYSFYHPMESRRLSQPSWLASYQDGLPARSQSPIQVLTKPSIEQRRWFNAKSYHYATAPTNNVLYTVYIHQIKPLVVKLLNCSWCFGNHWCLSQNNFVSC